MPDVNHQFLEALQMSQSGKGLQVMSVGQLRDFASCARAAGAVLCNVETFEIRGDDEVARINLSIYQGGAEEQVLSNRERTELADNTLQNMLVVMEKEEVKLFFIV